MKNKQTYCHRTLVAMLCAILALFKMEAQDLAGYIEQAETNNADLKAYEVRYSIAQEKSNEVKSLPDTEFAAGYFVSTPETRVGAQRARFSVKQMLPWFGSINARVNYQDALAEATYVEYTIAKRKLRLEVAQSYYELYGIKASAAVLEESLKLLKSYEELALNSVEVGKASAVDFLKIQIRQNDLIAQLEALEEDLKAAKIQFNTVLNVSETSPVFVVDSLVLPQSDVEVSIKDLSQNPEILQYDKLYESITQSEFVNQRDAAPKLGVGLDYIPVSERTDMNMLDNGKDVVMPMISVSVPIFNSKYKSVSRQNELKQEELSAQKNQRLNTLKNFFADALKNRNTARINYTKEVKNLKQARDAEEILLKNYETGTLDFNEILDIQELQLQFNKNQINAVQRYYEQTALINYLITF
ncbi:TolC family protein [Leeuwenhoekiella sp. W20_SRS_FM14]|uniref:TolC family protein n=1 Tax=Leeuwenhoekiella sp. W20_SRS_FM14 TaxID=3240270 RepID=UPI003F94B058